MVEKAILVAECGINCNGSVDTAKQLIDVAASNGIQYVKFQKRDVENGGCYTKEELDAPRESPWGTTTRQQKLGLEFSIDQYKAIDMHCKRRGVGWFVSCWDTPSIDVMEANFPDMPYHKAASAKLTDRAFLRALAATGKPVVLSTGMSSPNQVVEASAILGGSLAFLMHCTSTYPTRPDEMNLGVIRTMAQEAEYYGLKYKVGFSNHYSGISWAPLAVALGAEMLEFHITLDRTMYGSDQAASIEPDGVRKMVELINVAQSMMGDGKKCVYASELPIIKKLRKISDF